MVVGVIANSNRVQRTSVIEWKRSDRLPGRLRQELLFDHRLETNHPAPLTPIGHGRQPGSRTSRLVGERLAPR